MSFKAHLAEFGSKSKKNQYGLEWAAPQGNIDNLAEDLSHTFPAYASETSVESTNPPSEKVCATVWTKQPKQTDIAIKVAMYSNPTHFI